MSLREQAIWESVGARFKPCLAERLRNMGLISLASEGTWGLHSKSDPRWNISGRTTWGVTGGCPPQARDAISELSAMYGDAPADLEWSFYKD